MASEPENKPPILHILVVGFHHKLGCQVEFSHPPLIAGSTGRNECPSGWKYLPTLALPDGSHNFIEDTVFFNLPSLFEPAESIYGVSCYRQIPVEKLKIRTADVTRSTVQKSVCILARLPIYGYIEVKLSLIADAFFDQGDFSCTELLVKAYQQLNSCLLDEETRRPLRHFHVGLSLREIVLQWRHKTLILFKLLLLQRRVVCFGSPVRGMCVLILGMASLVPRLLEKGFQEVACVRTSRPLSPMPDFTDSLQREAEVDIETETEAETDAVVEIEPDALPEAEDLTLVSSAASAGSQCCNSSGNTSPRTTPNSQSQDSSCPTTTPTHHGLHRVDSTESGTSAGGGKRNGRSSSLTREASVDTLASNLAALCAINPDEYRAPVSIFASGNLCLPYLSLPYMDLLSDPMVLSYIIGTSNVLFQQKRQLADVLVDIESANLDAHDPELRRQLVLSTEDLRYMDYILKHVQTPKEDAEGSEYWIREQFQGYILALLRTAIAPDVKDNDHFNPNFMNAFKRTQCYQEWFDVRPEPEFFDALPVGHPFAGTLSVADMKLKLAQTMQNSESGRKINQAVNNTSRAVGGAISQAKGALSSWWSSMMTAPANSTGNGASVSGAGSDSSQSHIDEGIDGAAASQEPPEISVTFQNHKDEAELDVTGVSIHMASRICNDNQEEALESSSSSPQQQQQQPQGIVEIGREAELLDKITPEDHAMAATTNQTQSQPLRAGCGGDLALSTGTASAVECNNGDVFIV
ncbi:late secretory pathway protein AVL9 homolog [Drosophila grimshawi]|uniref:GH12502 n=1 Tax=Drosophila grimshawi TaxID=7222 RepID=B4JJJ4_DROGR|nr:late secretory pathway protein AVL9 homolog [Drosophila grimshawi]XP_032593840.1 late secretory pathway protein AVL9 homolog [Drosophila grimshawi]EDV99746.1 GH12502 [Drosophila grimshawi]